MYGAYKNKVAINIPDALRPGAVVPSQRAAGDAQLEPRRQHMGLGASTSGMLYEFTPGTRLSFTWNSQVDLDFSAPAQFSNLGNFGATLQSNGLLNPTVEVGIKVPQQVMVSMSTQVNDRWAVLGSLGWQQWSKFGQVQLGIDCEQARPASPRTWTSRTRGTSPPAHSTGSPSRGCSTSASLTTPVFQDSSNVSPLLPAQFGMAIRRGRAETT